MIQTADPDGLVLAGADGDLIEWSHVLCIFGVRLPEDENCFHLFFDVFVSGIRRFDIPETHDRFRDVLRAVDQHLVSVVPEDDRKTVDWERLISYAEPNERVLIWWTDHFMPGGWPAKPHQPLGHFLNQSPFLDLLEEDDHAGRSSADAAYYDWLDNAAADFAAKPPQEFTLFEVLYWLQAEVLNGGLHQYFTNSLSDRADHAVLALRMISAHDAADALETAMHTAFDGPCPQDLLKRQTLLQDADDELLETLDALNDVVATGWLGLLHDHVVQSPST